MDHEIVFRIRPEITNSEMDALRAEGFPNHVPGHDWRPQLERSLLWVGAYADERLVGFVNVAWDGGVHAFLLDTAVALDLRGRGIGTALVQEAIVAVGEVGGIEWLHVDADADLMRRFYEPTGFEPTPAGLVRIAPPS